MLHLSSLVFLHVIHCNCLCQNHHYHHDYSTSKTTALPPPLLLLLWSDNKSHHQKGLSPICSPMKTHLHRTTHTPSHISAVSSHATTRRQSSSHAFTCQICICKPHPLHHLRHVSPRWRHHCHVMKLMSSLPRHQLRHSQVSCLRHPLIVVVDFLLSKCSLVFRVYFIFVVYFCIFCF